MNPGQQSASAWACALVLALCTGAGSGCSSSDDTPETTEEFARTTQNLAIGICGTLLAQQCAQTYADEAQLQAARVACVEQWTQDALIKQESGCAEAAVIDEMHCVLRTIGCPSTRPAEKIAIDALAEPAIHECGEGHNTTACSADRLPCEPAPGGALPELDLNGDGAPDPLPDNLEDRRVICAHEPSEDLLVIESPPIVVPAGAELFTCVYDTWTGPEMGIVGSKHATDAISDHHVLVFAAPDEVDPTILDGQPFDCLAGEHKQGKPLFHGLGTTSKIIGSRQKSGHR